MANVPHSGLTGGDLHESKGVAAAAANTVHVADGAGSGSYQKVPLAALSASANAFGGQLLHVQEQEASGVASGNASTVSVFITTFLNTVLTNEITGASLGSSQITLPAGTYYIEALIPWVVSSSTATGYFCKPRLLNVTSSTVLLNGIPGQVFGLQNGGAVASLKGRFTLAGTSVLVLQHDKNGGNIGQPYGFSPEIYSEVLIWKTA